MTAAARTTRRGRCRGHRSDVVTQATVHLEEIIILVGGVVPRIFTAVLAVVLPTVVR